MKKKILSHLEGGVVKRVKYYLFFILLFFFFISSDIFTESKNLTREDNQLNNFLAGVKYETGNWTHPDYSKPFKSYGNHRFLVRTEKPSEYIRVKIWWRRPDADPKKKSVAVVASTGNREIRNVKIIKVNNSFGEIVFRGEKGCKDYYIYYFPYKSTGGYYPKVVYFPSKNHSDPEWMAGYSVSGKVTDAKVIAYQSIDGFNSFFPMEVIALKREVDSFVKKYPKPIYLFPEFRDYPIRMSKFLPYHWVRRGIKNGLNDKVSRGEFYTFQLGVWSPFKDLTNLKVEFSGLTSKRGKKIEITGLECFNLSGIDLDGNKFSKKLSVGKGYVQALWFGIDIPVSAEPGLYHGRIKVFSDSTDSASSEILLEVKKDILKNHGDSNPKNMSRLRWLNSTIGEEKDFIVKPFVPVSFKKRKISILGRDIYLDKSGLPLKIQSFFSKKMTSFLKKPLDIIDDNFDFKVEDHRGSFEKWNFRPYRIRQDHKSSAYWSVKGESTRFAINISGRIEYDGMVDYRIKLKALKETDLKDIILTIPMKRDAAEYMMGLGRKGGKRPEKFLWHWNVEFCHEGAWLGNVNRGLQFVLRDLNYERPLNTNFYHNKPLKLPFSWGNKGKGGIKFSGVQSGTVAVDCFSGPRRMKKGETLNFNFRLFITPFKLIDLKKHFKTRFVHKYLPVDDVLKLGGTVVNVHHATEINPYINYPFYNLNKQKRYIDEAHDKGIKVKLYNTIRELTYRAYELFPLRSLGTEIFNDGTGGGHSWLQEHLRSNYHSAWHATNVNDAAILNKGTSRWTNYYIEGLNWLAKNQKIDGLYLDDIAFSRETVKRIATVLNKNRDEVIIDLHSANQFNKRDGFVNSAFLYMEHFPYISRLWFGEYFEYNEGPDYWLTEVSGIPFGLTGEMLEKGGHPFRGLVYGMTNRVYGKYSPAELWKLFDSFDIAGSDMFGYWIKNSPVKTAVKNIRSTVYKNEKGLLIAIGSWLNRDESVKLYINWNKTGFKKADSVLYAPEIKGLQKKRFFNVDNPVHVKKEKGLILILKKVK